MVELRTEQRKLAGPHNAIRVAEGDAVEPRAARGEAGQSHLHGYDVLSNLMPRETATRRFEAFARGAFR